MNAPDNWLEICSEELERGSLVSNPRKFDFARKRGMKNLDEVHDWMHRTRKNFCNMVTSAMHDRDQSNVKIDNNISK